MSFLTTFRFFFFFNDTATTEIYPLSLHDALPISAGGLRLSPAGGADLRVPLAVHPGGPGLSGSAGAVAQSGQCQRQADRSEEHTSELQSLRHLVCRLLLEKKKILIYSEACELLQT